VTSRVLVLVATVMAAVMALSIGGERPGPILRATAGGALQLESSRDGAAVLTASRLRPGDSAEGTLTLKNLAPGVQQLTLETTDLQDTPGAGGGRLARWVDLRVERDGAEVYAGKLEDLTTLDLGDLAGGSTTPLRFVVTLPEHGPAVDDAYAGGSVEVEWTWRGLADVEGGGEGEEGDPPPPPRKEEPPVVAQPEERRPDVAPSGRDAVRPPAIDELVGPAPAGAPRVRLWLGDRSRQRVGSRLGVSALCRPGCAVSVVGRVRAGGRWRSLGTRSLGAVLAGSQPTALRFRLGARQQRSLRALLARHGSLTVRLAVTAVADGHSPVTKVRTLRLRP
jgi:spore coat-associated protein N